MIFREKYERVSLLVNWVLKRMSEGFIVNTKDGYEEKVKA